MPSEAYLTRLTAGTPVEVRPSTFGGGHGVFALSDIDPDSVIVSDAPLCWASDDASEGNCARCGAYLGTPASQLARAAGVESVELPAVAGEELPPCCRTRCGSDGSCGADCPRRLALLPGDGLGAPRRDASERLFARLGAQLAAVLLAARRDGQPDWRAPLDALASPDWSEVVRSDPRKAGEPDLAAATLGPLVAELSAALGERAVAEEEGGSLLLLWSRVLGAAARNAMQVKLPHPLVFHFVAMPPRVPRALASAIERLRERRRLSCGFGL